MRIRATNPFNAADTYKDGHWEMMPDGVEQITSYIEPRAGRRFPRVRLFGLQGYIKSYLMHSLNEQEFDEADRLSELHGPRLNPFLRDMVRELGYWPLKIWALPEGVVVPAGTPVVKIRSTHPKFTWLASWIETQIIRGVWYPTSTCTNSFEMLSALAAEYKRTGTPLDFLPFALHDFGARGASSGESAAIGGAGHLVNSMGTDTKEALEYHAKYYNEPCAGFSVLASEHSVTTMWGKDREREFFEMICNKFGTRPNCMISIVMDSWDQDAAFNLFCNELKPLVLETFGKTPGAKLIFRPDSGYPVGNVTKYPIQLIDSYGNVSTTRYAKMPDFIGLIQGDGIDLKMVQDCVRGMTDVGLRPDNAAFGSGGGLLQKVTRDYAGFAQKVCHVVIDGVAHEVRKAPAGEPSKWSKGGDLAVYIDDNGEYQSTTVDQLGGRKDEFVLYYENGHLFVDDSLSTIRSRATF